MSEYQRQIQHAKEVRARLAANGRADIRRRERATAAWTRQDESIISHLWKVRTTFAEILDEVSKKYMVSSIDIKSMRKTNALTKPRFEICWRATHETELSSPAIGRRLGDRDHTTILHAVRRFQEMIDKGEVAVPGSDDDVDYDVFRDIRDTICQKHRICFSEISVNSAYKYVRVARDEICWRTTKETKLESADIARLTGFREVASVKHAVDRHQERLDAGEATYPVGWHETQKGTQDDHAKDV